MSSPPSFIREDYLSDFIIMCYNGKRRINMKQILRNKVLVVKVTAKEKKRITEYAKGQCVNVSALVRKLLFERLEKGA